MALARWVAPDTGGNIPVARLVLDGALLAATLGFMLGPAVVGVLALAGVLA